MKQIQFLGSSRRDIKKFAEPARRLAGFELQKVQAGGQPRDFKPMSSIGTGVQELRIWVEAGTYRVIYLATLKDVVYVLHAFEKKTQVTDKTDIDLARQRFSQIERK